MIGIYQVQCVSIPWHRAAANRSPPIDFFQSKWSNLSVVDDGKNKKSEIPIYASYCFARPGHELR